VFEDLNVGTRFDFFQQDPFDFTPRKISGMDNAPRRMTAFNSQIKPRTGHGLVQCELNAPLGQLGNPLGAACDHHFHHLGVTEPIAHPEGILNVQLEGVFLVENACNASLRVVGI
jgi:hypothetical protein